MDINLGLHVEDKMGEAGDGQEDEQAFQEDCQGALGSVFHLE